jgi:hypothetical protein
MAALLVALAALPVAAEVRVDNAWVRPTAPGQQVAGAFMDLTADADMRLVGAESPTAKVVELHTMSMDKGVMVMRRVPSIDLPKGKTVSLAPGGLHVMLIDLVGQIKEGDKAPITLLLKGTDGRQLKLTVEAVAKMETGPVRHRGHMH